MQYCFQTYNSSCTKEVRSPAVYVVMYISAVAVVMLTVCGNLIVIVSISHFKQLHTPTNFLVLSLAVADFLVGLTVMPFCLILLIETCWYFGEKFCILYKTIGCIVASVSVYNIACIAIDRYLAVCDPLLYSIKITANLTRIAILHVWLLSVLYSLALLYFNGNISSAEKHNTCLGECLFFINDMWSMADIIIFMLPCFVMLLLYGKVFIVARSHAKVISSFKEQLPFSHERKGRISMKSERKAAKTLGMVVFIFLMCLMPYYICGFVYADMNLSFSSIVNNFLTWLVYFNSSLNPIIYALFYPWFQKTVKLIVTLRIFNTASSLITLFQ
ncbi:trace amine-associated receptor 13c-like [Lepisosteus oculatus]